MEQSLEKQQKEQQRVQQKKQLKVRAGKGSLVAEPGKRSEKVENVVNRLDLKESLKENLVRRPNSSEQTGPPNAKQPSAQPDSLESLGMGLEKNLVTKLEQQKSSLHPVQPLSDRRPSGKNPEHNEPSKFRDSLMENTKPSQRQPICCPNCKMILPTSLFIEQGTCQSFCTVHCPHVQPADGHTESVRQTEDTKQTKTVKQMDKTASGHKSVENFTNIESNRRTQSNLPAIQEELKQSIAHYNRPYNLLVPERTARGLPVSNRLESERRPVKEPAEETKRSADAHLNSSQNLVDQSTTGICCKCGLKVRFNERANSTPAKCLRCSQCGCPLSPGRHSANGEAVHCTAACTSRLHGADSYAFNVKHT